MSHIYHLTCNQLLIIVLFLDSVKWGGVCVCVCGGGGGGGGGLGVVYIQNIGLECKIFNSKK